MSVTIEHVVRRKALVTCPHCHASVERRSARRPCSECGNVMGNVRAPKPLADARVIDGDAILVDEDGVVVGVQVVDAEALAHRLGGQLNAIKWERSGNEGRLSGISVVHRTFGFAPPVPLRRRHACTRCRFDFDYPIVAETLEQMCEHMDQVFREYAPGVYDLSAANVKALIPEGWRLGSTPWTSGIINHTAALPYHRDSGNIPGSWSAMMTARHAVGGGLLHLVDYDVWLACPNGATAIFDGQSVLHGVSPLESQRTDGYRFTLVTYARTGMKVCAPDPADEARRAQLAATVSQDRQAVEVRARRER